MERWNKSEQELNLAHKYATVEEVKKGNMPILNRQTEAAPSPKLVRIALKTTNSQ